MPAVPAKPTSAVRVGRGHLLDVPLGDHVAHRGPAVAGHQRRRRAYVAATIVVACGARSPAWPGGSGRRPGSRSGATDRSKSVNDGHPRAPGRRRAAACGHGQRARNSSSSSRQSAQSPRPGSDPSDHCPPFWTYPRTNSSAFSSSTSSISSRIASTSSVSFSCRSWTSVSVLASTSSTSSCAGWPCSGRRRSLVSPSEPPHPGVPTLVGGQDRGTRLTRRRAPPRARPPWANGPAARRRAPWCRAAAPASGTRTSDSRPRSKMTESQEAAATWAG